MDLGTPFEYMPESMGIHHLFCSQLYKIQINPNQNLTFMGYINKIKTLTLFANPIRITLISWTTNTNSSMSGDLTFCIHSTRASEAWILAFFPNTCKMVWAFWVSCAFRSWCWKKNHAILYMLFITETNSTLTLQITETLFDYDLGQVTVSF